MLREMKIPVDPPYKQLWDKGMLKRYPEMWDVVIPCVYL